MCTFRNVLLQNDKEKENEKIMFIEVGFKDCVFKETNTFGEKIFELERKPLFIDCTFEGQFNIEHKYLQYSYQDIESKIIKKDKGEINPSLWRDLFRRLKSNRLAYHNLIDASELRKQELYAREIELENKKSPLFSQDWIEKWQLWFYRLTSDHHTNLLKSFHSLLILIAIFGATSFGVVVCFDAYFGFLVLAHWEHFNLAFEFYNSHIKVLVVNHWLCIFGINLGLILAFLLLFWISCVFTHQNRTQKLNRAKLIESKKDKREIKAFSFLPAILYCITKQV